MKNQKGFSLIELMIVFAIIGILAAAIANSGNGISIGDGDRVGIITKLSYRGIKWKTWEGQMILGGQGTVTTNIWNFSVTDPDVLKDLQDALDSQKIVKLSYHQNLILRPWMGATTYFIKKVTPVHK